MASSGLRTKILIPFDLYTSYKAAYDKSLEEDNKGPAKHNLRGEGPSSINSDSDFEVQSEKESELDQEKEYDPTQIAANLSGNEGLQNPLDKDVSLINEEQAPQNFDSDDILLKKFTWKRHHKSVSRLLNLMKKSKEVHWDQDGNLFIRGENVHLYMKKALPCLFQRSSPVPPNINQLLAVICDLSLDHLVKNDALIRNDQFEWYFLGDDLSEKK